jgi:hypothetical protein
MNAVCSAAKPAAGARLAKAPVAFRARGGLAAAHAFSLHAKEVQGPFSFLAERPQGAFSFLSSREEFARPDVPAARGSRRAPAAAAAALGPDDAADEAPGAGAPRFRSALEQVSYMTSQSAAAFAMHT